MPELHDYFNFKKNESPYDLSPSQNTKGPKLKQINVRTE